jgi:hypothetical protein
MEIALYFYISQESLVALKQMSQHIVGTFHGLFATAQCPWMGLVAYLGLVPSHWPLGTSPKSKPPSHIQDAPGTARETEWNVPFGPFYIRLRGYN